MKQDLYSLREIEKFSKMNPESRIEYFKKVAAQALPFWDFAPSTEIKLLNYTENATFKVMPKDAEPFIMRIHRALYTTKNSILSEIDWLKNLSEDGISVPKPIPMKDGNYVAEIKTDLGDTRLVDCSKFESGVPPMGIPDIKSFERLGEIIARLHLNAEKYKKPEFYERIVWNEDETFTLRNNYHFIDYQGAKVFTDEDKAVLHDAEVKIRSKLAAYGKNSKNYGLIHSDVRFSNILVDNGQFKLLDFDDAGDGWFMFDVGGILATNEDIPEADEIMDAVIRGYVRVRPLSAEDKEMIPTFQLFRRLGVVAFSQFIVVESVLGNGETCSTENSFWDDYYKKTVEAAKKYLAA
jgi:Ser/Thr protein kinase RdoA (MazF antagonist)